MLDRNERREIFTNDHPTYKKFLRQRGIKSFKHYGRLSISNITPEDISGLTVIDHLWQTGDSLYKLSHKYYGDSRHWWIIAWFNKRPIVNLYRPGILVHIPLPIEEAFYYVSKNE